MKKITLSLIISLLVFFGLSVSRSTVLAYCPLAVSQQSGSLKYSFNNQWMHYVTFKAPFTGKVDLIDIKVGNWGNSWRYISCKVTNSTGTVNISTVGISAMFKSAGAAGFGWWGADFSGAKSFSLTGDTTYRLYCKGPDSWNSLYWIYNKLGDPNSKTFHIFMCRL